MTLVGEKLAVTPAGRPLAERLMVWALPDVTAVDTVTMRLIPGVSVTVVGDTPTEKSFPLPPTDTMTALAVVAFAALKSKVYEPGSEIPRSVNCATPDWARTVVWPSNRPGPPMSDAVTSALALPTLPLRFTNVTTGCDRNTTPA